MGLLLSNKAMMIANGRGYIQTPATAFPRPSIIRLGYMIQRPRPCLKLTKQEIFQRDNFTCQYCGHRGGKLTIDHVVPRHLGGEQTWTNLVTACEACNRKKGGKSAQDAHMRLLRGPFEPPSSAVYLYRRYLKHNQDWQIYVEGW